MKGIYNHIPETHRVSRAYKGAAILWLHNMVYGMLFPMTNVSYFYISTLRSMYAVSIYNNNYYYY
jgi:hypothetical protein